MHSLHDPFSELFGLISQHLSLPTDELGLDLSEFLGLSHTNELVSKVERFDRVSSAANIDRPRMADVC